MHIAKARNSLHSFAIGLGRGYQFQQAHVARRIEKVRAEPMAAEIVAESFRDFIHRQAAGVRGDDCPGAPPRFHPAQQVALDVQVFDYRLDDPIAIRERLQVVFEVADLDQPCQRSLKEGRRLRFLQCLQRCRGNAIARGTSCVGCRHIEQQRRHAGVRHMRSNARAHGAGAQNCNLADHACHS